VEDLTAILTAAIEHLRNEPRIAVGAILLAALLYYLLQRKSRLERDAERRLNQLKRDKAGHYDHLRPPQ
jgi:predicted PurR-regulated permease PerM